MALAAAFCGAVAPADAANRRIAISNYSWSDPALELGLGEHVTWYWTGPDLMHSVTGDSPNILGIDSDLGINLPQHRIGDKFRVDFETPGTYAFACKLHSAVGGIVNVSSDPGDPVAEPDPEPKASFDRKPPEIRRIELSPRRLRARGMPLRLRLDERSRLDAEYYLLANGEREFVGYERWRGYVGFNQFRFGGRASHFRAEPGRYEALLRATDGANNISRPKKIGFEIYAPGS